MPVPFKGAERSAAFAGHGVFLNPAARQVFASDRLQLQDGLQLRRVNVAGSVNAGGGRWR